MLGVLKGCWCCVWKEGVKMSGVREGSAHVVEEIMKGEERDKRSACLLKSDNNECRMSEGIKSSYWGM